MTELVTGLSATVDATPELTLHWEREGLDRRLVLSRVMAGQTWLDGVVGHITPNGDRVVFLYSIHHGEPSWESMPYRSTLEARIDYAVGYLLGLENARLGNTDNGII